MSKLCWKPQLLRGFFWRRQTGFPKHLSVSIAMRISPWDARFAHAPRNSYPHWKFLGNFEGLVANLGCIVFFPLFSGVTKNPWNSMLISHKKHADFPQKNRRNEKNGCHWLSSTQFMSNWTISHQFFSWWKMPKKESLKFHPIQIGWLHPIPWKKKSLPRNFPKGPISLWAAWQHVGPGSWGPELTWKPWVNGPILVGEEATDPTIPNQNLKGSLVKDCF